MLPVNPVQFSKVSLKLFTKGLLSNKPLGIDVNPVQFKKVL